MPAKKNAKTRLQMSQAYYTTKCLKLFLGELGQKRGHRITHVSQVLDRRFFRKLRSGI